MRIEATSVADYLQKVPQERRAALTNVYKLVRARLPKGYEEGLQYGAITWFVPPERYGQSYNGFPLAVASLASQKQYMALYLNCGYTAGDGGALAAAFAAAGKRLDMGKSCLRFRKLEDLVLDAVGDYVATFTVDRFLAFYEAGQAGRKQKPVRRESPPAAPTKNKKPATKAATPAAKAKKPAPRPAPKAKKPAKAKKVAKKPARADAARQRKAPAKRAQARTKRKPAG